MITVKLTEVEAQRIARLLKWRIRMDDMQLAPSAGLMYVARDPALAQKERELNEKARASRELCRSILLKIEP